MSFRILLISIIFLVVLAKGISPSCGECLTYRDVVRDALYNSTRVRMKVEDIRISEATYKQNFAGLFPTISVNSRLERYENLDKRTQQGITTISGEVVGGDQSAWRSTFYLWGEYYLSHWYKKRFEALYYEKLKDARIHECAVETKKLLQELTDVYSSLVEEKIRLKYSAEILLRLQGALALKKEAFTKGHVSYEDVLKAEADTVNVDREIAGIRKELKENLEKLYSYTGMTYSDETEFETFALHGQKQFTVAENTIAETPEYKVRVKEHEAFQQKAKASENNFWPDVSLYGRYDYYGSNTNGPDNSLRDVRETSYRAGILISFPLFDGGARKWERIKSNHEIKKQEESIKAVAEEKGRDIKALSAGYNELSKAHTHYRKLADQHRKMLEITKKAHVLGERSITDILEMEKDALAIERDLKVTEHIAAHYGMRLMLETDYHSFLREYYGNGTCKY